MIGTCWIREGAHSKIMTSPFLDEVAENGGGEVTLWIAVPRTSASSCITEKMNW